MRFASSTIDAISSGSRTWTRGRTSPPSGQRDAFPPVRDVHLEPQGRDLRGERELRRRVAVDEEDRLRIARLAGLPAGAEVPDPVEQLRFVRVRREAAD